MPIASKEKSRIKMVIMLKNGNDHLKLTDQNGRLNCPVQYSILSKDKKPAETIIKGMIRRFKTKNTMNNITNCLIFIDQNTNQCIHKEML